MDKTELCEKMTDMLELMDSAEMISELAELGEWARLRERYLQEYRPEYYQDLRDEMTIVNHLMETEKEADLMMETATRQYLERFPQSTQSTAEAYAREIVLREIISSGEPEETKDEDFPDEA